VGLRTEANASLVLGIKVIVGQATTGELQVADWLSEAHGLLTWVLNTKVVALSRITLFDCAAILIYGQHAEAMSATQTKTTNP